MTKKLHKFNLYVYSKFNFFCFVIFPKELITKKVFEFIFFVTTQKILILIRKSKLYHFILVFRLLFTKWSEVGSSNKKFKQTTKIRVYTIFKPESSNCFKSKYIEEQTEDPLYANLEITCLRFVCFFSTLHRTYWLTCVCLFHSLKNNPRLKSN